MDTIFIEKLSLRGKHGVHDHERNTEQEFLIDISVEFDARAAAHSDDLADTVNYSDFAAIAKEIVERESFYLIERLGEVIAAKILEDTRIKSVAVTIRKPAAFRNGIPGVTIHRHS